MRRRTEGVLIGGEIAPTGRDPLPFPSAEVVASLEPFVTEARRARMKEVIAERLDSVTVVVDALHDPHNGAALIRSCDAFGVQTLHAIERLEPLAIASTVARGSQKWIDVWRHANAESCIDALRASGHELIATHPEGDLTPEKLAEIPRFALLLGNERDGISPALRAACSRTVKVPMVGFVESLNVSVTAAILIYCATRNRRGDLDESQRQALYARALWLTVPNPTEHLETHRSRGR
ncbi:MAG: RNA methyltransferase [Polyangiales bacterium]